MRSLTSSSVISFTTGLLCISFARCPNLSVLMVSTEHLYFQKLLLWYSQIKASFQINLVMNTYFSSGEMAHITVSFELPPSDSLSKWVKQELLYGMLLDCSDWFVPARILTKFLHNANNMSNWKQPVIYHTQYKKKLSHTQVVIWTFSQILLPWHTLY